jgi:hypothetical protein
MSHTMKGSRATSFARAGAARNLARRRTPHPSQEIPSRRERSRARRQAAWERRFRWAFWAVALVVFADLLFNTGRIVLHWPF